MRTTPDHQTRHERAQIELREMQRREDYQLHKEWEKFIEDQRIYGQWRGRP